MDYFATVRPGETRRLPYIVRMDGRIAEIMCPESNVRLMADVWFPTLEDQDAFLESRRRQLDLFQNKGMVTFLRREEGLATSVGEDEQPVHLKTKNTAKVFGVTIDELKYAGRIALRAIMETYRT